MTRNGSSARRVPVATGGYAVRVVGMSELVRNQERSFLTALDDITEMRPEDTELVADASPQYRRSRLYLESLLRRTPPTDDKVYLGHQAALNFARYQLVPAHRALAALRPGHRHLRRRRHRQDAGSRHPAVRVDQAGPGRAHPRRRPQVHPGPVPAGTLEPVLHPAGPPRHRGLQRVRAKIPANKNPFYYFSTGHHQHRHAQERWPLPDLSGAVPLGRASCIDECHHVANADAQRGRLASLLARTCDSLILTSATPHNGKPEGFANLMNMLEPTAVADPSNYTKDEIKGLFVRRFKKDIEDEVGQHFRERKTEIAHSSTATDAEEKILARIKGLKFHTLNRKSPGQTRTSSSRTTLLKAFLSSPHACLETVENRLIHRTDRCRYLFFVQLRALEPGRTDRQRRRGRLYV